MIEMASRSAILSIVCLFVCAVSVWAQMCNDIDTAACKLIATQRPDMCTDDSLSKTACPRFCKLCPVECYDCNATVLDYHQCNTTMLCGEGEVCMRKELKSFVDGHHEYQMTCERKELCDGSGVSFPFGKRAADTRDISLTCCSDDLCNYPEWTPNIVGCAGKDIVFMVDESSRIAQSEYSDVINFLFHVVNGLDIGVKDNMIALSTFALQVHEQFNLQRYPDKYDLLRALQHQHPTGGLLSFINREDTNTAIKFLVQHALQPANGDRVPYNDVVVIITDATTARHVNVNLDLEHQLQHASNNVIVISVGPEGSTHPAEQVASDKNHVIHVPTYSALDASLVTSLLTFIKSC